MTISSGLLCSDRILTVNDYSENFSRWLNFLRKIFGGNISSNLFLKSVVDYKSKAPNLRSMLFMPKDLTLSNIISKLEELMPVDLYIEKPEIPKVWSVRSSDKETYAIWHSGLKEADPHLRGYSQYEVKNILPLSIGMTLEERLLLELKYFIESNGDHLDSDSITLCVGSESRLGAIPSVEWRTDKLLINLHHTMSSKSPKMGPRLVEPVKFNNI